MAENPEADGAVGAAAAAFSCGEREREV